MLQYTDYNETYGDNIIKDFSNLPSLEEELIEYDAISPFAKKLINTTRSAQEKLELVNKHKLNKELDIEGYQQGNIISMSDADSGVFTDTEGNQINFRFADLNPIDAIDKQKAREASSYKTRLQPKLVADLVGKDEKDLIEDDFINVANYQFNEMIGALSDKDYKFTPYNKNIKYETSNIKSIPFSYKIVGEDNYGRKLIEAINPNTGRQISFDMSNNPYLNSSFDLYKSINSRYNNKRLQEYTNSIQESKQSLIDIFDTDGRLGESIDLAQSTAYQTAARVLQYGPDWLVDKEKWDAIADPRTGQALADAWAGVKTSTRRKYAIAMSKAINDWDKGNYIDSIITIATQFDRMLAESATQMGVIMGGSMVGGAIATATGASAAIASGVAVLSGAMLAAIDSTLMTNEDYKVNNNEKNMSADKIATTFAINTALLIPESIFTGFSISKFIPKKLVDKIGLAYKSTSSIEAAKIVAGSTISEGIQEMSQDTFNEYMSQNQNNPKSLMEIASSPEIAISGVAGAVMGAGLSSVPTSIGTIRNTYIDNKNSKIRERVNIENKNITVSGTEANIELSDSINKELDNTTVDYTDVNAIKQEYSKLQEQLKNTDINVEIVEKLNKKKSELVYNYIKSTKEAADRDAFLKAIGKSKEEVFEEAVYFSDLNSKRLYEKTGKRITKSREKEVTKELLEVAKSLNISEDVAKRTFKEVKADIRYGAKGYYTYKNTIENIENKLTDTTISDEDKANLVSKKESLINKLIYLYNNQVNKLDKFANAIEQISEGKTNSVTFEYPSMEGSFTVKSTDVATNLRNSTRGTFGVVNSVEQEINNIKDILTKHTTPEELNSLGINNDVLTISERITNAATNIRNRSKSVAVTTVTGKTKDVSKTSIRDLQVKLRNIGTDKLSDKSKANLIGYLRNIPQDKLEEVRQNTINSNLNQTQKDLILKGIDTVLEIETTTVQETGAINTKNTELTEKVKNILNTVTDDILNSKDVTVISSKLKELRKIYSDIHSLNLKTNKDILEKIVKVGNKLRDNYVKLIKDKTTTELNNNLQQGNINLSVDSLLIDSTNNSVILGNELPIYKNNIVNGKKTKSKIGTFKFNLNNELMINRNTKSTLAIEGIKEDDKNTLLPEILDIANKIKFNPYNIKSIKNYFSYLLYKTDKDTNITAPNGLLYSSPHLRLLYNIKQEQKIINGKEVEGLNFEYNPITLFAIDLGVKELLTNMDLNSVLNPVTRKDLAATFGMSEETLSTTDVVKLKEHIKKYGIPKSVLANTLGKLIIDNLGIVANIESGTVGTYERIIAGLGMYGISYMSSMGYITENRFTTSDNSIIQNNMTCIKKTNKSIESLLDSYLGKKDKTGKRSGGLKDKYKIENTLIKTPRTTKESLPKNMTLRHTNGLIKVPSFTKKVLSKLWNTSYEIDLELIDFVRDNINNIKKRLSYSEEQNIGLLTFDEASSAEGVNLSIDNQFKYLFEYADMQKQTNTKFYFNWFISRNGRIFIDSNTLNPQTSKSVQRFMCLPSNMYKDFDINNKEHINAEYYAIAQAFDSLGTKETIQKLGDNINSLSLEKILQLRKDLVNEDEIAFKTKYKHLGIEGIENYGQCLNVLQHLIRKKQANSKIFKTWLAIENDSTTSGYFIRLLQFCNPKILNKFGEKVGIILSDNKLPHEVIHELKKIPGFLDIYKTMALDASKKLPSLSIEELKEVYINELNKIEFPVDALVTTFTKMYDALPKPTPEGTVDSALRTLLKSPSMIFGYTAGENSIKSSVSLEIMEKFISTYNEIYNNGGINKYLKIKNIDKNNTDGKKLIAITNTIEYLNTLSTVKNKPIIEQLKTKSSSEIWLRIGNKNITLDRYFNMVLGPTYGSAIWDSLSNSFKEYIAYNDSMNYMAVNMYNMFKSILDTQLDIVKNNNDNLNTKLFGISIKERNKIIKSLSSLLPTLPLFYSNNLDEGMLLMKTGKIKDKNTEVQNPIVINGKLVQESTNANVYDFTNPGKSGAVLPIHFIDGMMAMMTLNESNNVIPIHDAFVMSALDNKFITQTYNKLGYALNKDFNLYDTMVNRFIEIVKEYDNMSKHLSLPKSSELDAINGLNKSIIINKNPITVQELLSNVIELATRNNQERELFYNLDNPVYITNMDGIEGSGIEANINTTSLSDIIFKQAIEKWRQYSGPKEYVTDGEIRELLQDATDNVEARISLFDKLQELAKSLDNKVENENHLQHLKNLIKRIDIKKIQDIVIEISKNRPFTSGMLEEGTIVIGFDSKTEQLDKITKLSPYSDKSSAEIYAHELIHAASRFGLANSELFKTKTLINQLLKLQLAAKNIVTWEDFMPITYDTALKDIYEQNAKDIYSYIFNNPNIKNLEGLNEFIAYGLSNEKLVNKLKQHYTPSNLNVGKMTFLDKLITIINTLFNIVFGNKNLSDLISILSDITGSTVIQNKRNTLYKELEILTNKIIGANNEAVTSLKHQLNKPIEHLFKLLSNLRIAGNNVISPKLKYIFNLADIKGKTFDWLMNPNGNMFYNTVRFLNMLSLFLISKSRRQALIETISSIAGISQQNALISFLRDLKEPDLQSSRLELLTVLTRTVEQSSKSIESITANELINAFKKPLTEEEKIALTQSALFTDLSSLLDDNDITYIKKVLLDNNFRKKEIGKILYKLQNEKHYLYYKNQAYGLARFMVFGLGNSMQNLNAENIAKGLLTSHVTTEVSNTLIKNIDKLTTLYAIEFTKDNSNKILANLDDNGLHNFLVTHKNFVKESKEGIKTIDNKGNETIIKTITDIHTIKGYTKQLFDSTYDIKIDFKYKKTNLAKEGYSLVYELKNNNITQTNDLAVYRRTFSNPNRRNGAGFILSGANAIGSTLKDTAFKIKKETNIKDEIEQKDIWKLFINNISKEAQKFDKIIHTKDMTFEDFENLSSGYTPIISPNSNKAVDYRITMSNNNKQELLNMDMNGITILSKMYASQNTKLNATIRNKALIEFIKDDTKNNMIESTKRGRDTGYKYILLDKNADNKYLQKSWGVIPNELKIEIEKSNFYVREDWLQSLFGVPDISLTDLSIFTKHNLILIRRCIAIAEYILKTLTYIAKRNIVLLVPSVLLGNIWSNINYSIMNGANPIRVFKLQLANAKAIRTYLEDKKELNRIEFKERIGTATKEEIEKKNIYKSRLQNNIVHPLMEKGMYQSIVEDINPDELESIGKIAKLIKNNKIVGKVANPIKWMSRQLYMTEGTLIHDFIFAATQYSDFIARATEYQLQMEKAPKKYKIVEKNGKKYKETTNEYLEYEEKTTINILNAFINYDKPQSSIEQYLSDMGLFMFIKFAKRIQHVILNSTINNPMGVLMFLLGQNYIIDRDDILEQNLISKNWSALIHNPVDNFINAVTPMPLQYYFGMRNTGL